MKISEIRKDCENKKEKIDKIVNYLNSENIKIDSPYLLDNSEVFFNMIALGSAQAKAPEAEKFIARKCDLIKISPSLNRGDYRNPANDTYVELKVSFTNKEQNLNLRQLRLWQEVDFYVCIYIDEDNLKQSEVFLLTHEEMKNEVRQKGSATHGTAKANENNENIEYSITISMTGECRKIWHSKYFCQDLYEKIILGE